MERKIYKRKRENTTKRRIALLLAAVLCLSLGACGGKTTDAPAESSTDAQIPEEEDTGVWISEEEYAEYMQYRDLIDMLNAGHYNEALGYINLHAPTGADNTNATDTGTDNADSADQVQTIEITTDNWQEYFEIRQYLEETIYINAFEEPAHSRYSLYTLLTLKEEYAEKLNSDESKVAIEYNADYGQKTLP